MGFRCDLILPPTHVHVDFVLWAGVPQTVAWAEGQRGVGTSRLSVFKKNKMKVGLLREYQ